MSNLQELMLQWEEADEEVMNRTEVFSVGAEKDGMILTILFDEIIENMPESGYTCLRYFYLPNKWVVSCDHDKVDADTAFDWIASYVKL